LVSIGGGSISNQCVGIINGVLASYQTCHGQLAYSGAAAILLPLSTRTQSYLSKPDGSAPARRSRKCSPVNSNDPVFIPGSVASAA